MRAEVLVRLKRAAPLADGHIRNCDAPFGQESFDIAELQCEPMIEPHRSRDDFGRKSIYAIVRVLGHASIVGNRLSA